MKKNMQKQSGFTIIEVVLVLAIAGLIFLVVFLALPQLQRSQRDSQRQSDVGRMISAITTYSSNEGNGIPPSNATNVTTDVLGGGYIDAADWGYEVVDTVGAADVAGSATSTNGETVGYVQGEDCDGATTNSRAFAVSVDQENGPIFCREG